VPLLSPYISLMPNLPVLNTASTDDGTPTIRLSGAERVGLARDLANTVEGEVRFDLHNRMLYATDASLFQVEPIGVVIPSSVDDAVRAIEFCAARGLPMLPRGGGTSLAGQCTNNAVVIDLSVNCRALLGVDAAARVARVEPGVTIDELNEKLAKDGLFFAPDPATSKHANIGGCIGNNAAGARSLLYGRTSENLRSLEVAFADGSRAHLAAGSGLEPSNQAHGLTQRVVEIVARNATLIEARYPKTIRRNAGYGLDLVLQQMKRVLSTEQLDQIAAARVDDRESARRAAFEAALSSVNLAALLCGSEGTLAFTLGAELLLHPLPKHKGLAVLSFSSLDESIEAVVPILATKPSAVELLDDTIIELAMANTEYRKYVELMPAAPTLPLRAVLYVEYFADTPEELASRFEALRKLVQNAGIQCHTNAGAMLNAWKLRKAGEPLLHGIPGNRKPITFVEDNAVPVENLTTFVKEFRKIVAAHGTRAAYYAHASVGVLHVRPLIDVHDESDRDRMRSIAVQVADLARSLGGVMSGEHGDGRIRTPLVERHFGSELIEAMREVKRAFDPSNLLNPGNVVNIAGPQRSIESMTKRLRIMPDPAPTARQLAVPQVDTFFSYETEHGFDAAVEMCNGAGVCRKKQGGTMCPSYMATLDERHSTRGRGNALRLAITGQFSNDRTEVGGPPRWDDRGTIETLDLCLSCKACKTECPSNVDISKLKAEYTAQRYRAAGGPPLAALAFGNVRLLNRLGSMTAPIANAVNRAPPVKWLLEKVLKIDRRRSVPAFKASLAKDFGATTPDRTKNGAPIVALFGDCFTMYNDPRIGRAARRVLDAFGYRVELANAGCCGRAKISTGLLPQAIDEIDATLERLRPWIEDDAVRAIVVAEPSCLSAFKDDWLALKLRTPLVLRKTLAEKSWLVEQFVEKNWNSHPRRAEFREMRASADTRTSSTSVVNAASGTGDFLFHGHCHQKALWGSDSSAALLLRLLGPRLKLIDSGCCGMAGSFGYTTDRYDLSMKIGELVLMPAVRSAGTTATIVAPGTSCRHQIHDGTGVDALHPIEVIDLLLKR